MGNPLEPRVVPRPGAPSRRAGLAPIEVVLVVAIVSLPLIIAVLRTSVSMRTTVKRWIDNGLRRADPGQTPVTRAPDPGPPLPLLPTRSVAPVAGPGAGPGPGPGPARQPSLPGSGPVGSGQGAAPATGGTVNWRVLAAPPAGAAPARPGPADLPLTTPPDAASRTIPFSQLPAPYNRSPMFYGLSTYDGRVYIWENRIPPRRIEPGWPGWTEFRAAANGG